jgi:hypothetical protein
VRDKNGDVKRWEDGAVVYGMTDPDEKTLRRYAISWFERNLGKVIRQGLPLEKGRYRVSKGEGRRLVLLDKKTDGAVI